MHERISQSSGAGFFQATSGPGIACAAANLRKLLHHERGQHRHAAKSAWAFLAVDDVTLCASVAGSSVGSCAAEPAVRHFVDKRVGE